MLEPTLSDSVLARALPYLVDERVGIIKTVQEVRLVPGAPNFFHFAAEACNTRAFSRQVNFNVTGGAAADRDRALAKAVGEAIERYCSALYDVDELPLTAADDAPFACVKPSDFALYSDAQLASDGFPWVPFVGSTPVRWTEARGVVDGEARRVPAAMVYVPYSYYQGSGDSPIVQPISTGLAAHTTWERAALGGAYEVIERDAFTITWQAQLDPPQIRVETLPDEAYDLLQRFERTGSRVVIFDLTMDHGVPTILTVLLSPHADSPAQVFAAAASLDPGSAVRSALEELAHTRRYSQQIKSRMERLGGDPGHGNVVDQVDHLNLYTDHANAGLSKFLFTSKKRIDFDDIPDRSTGDPATDLRRVADRIASVGHHLLVADLTTADVRSAGFFVVRAVIPGFHPLFMGHRIRALGGRRLWEVPGKLGYAGRSPEQGDNPAPHPYP